MKDVVQLVRLSALALLAAAALPANAGVIDILRGEPPEPTPLRRVAFVGSAGVKEVQGSAERLSGVDSWTPLRAGTELEPGDIIRTAQGTVVLKMTESGSLVRVTPNVMLRLAPLEPGWDRGILSGNEERDGFAVRACRGRAGYRVGGGEWRSVAVNDVLPEGATVRLAERTVLDLYSIAERRTLRLEKEAETVLTARKTAEPTIAAVLP